VTESKEKQGWFKKGLEHHLQGRLEEALSAYSRVPEGDPFYVDALRNMGALYLARGELNHASETLTRALTIEPDHPGTLNNLATTLKAQGRLPDALALFKKLLDLTPDFLEAWHNLGQLYLELGRYPEGVEAFSKVLAKNPFDHETWNSLGTAYSRQGRSWEAREAYERSLSIKPDQARPHYNLGLLFLNQGELELAASHFETTLRIAPYFPEARLNLGIALFSLGRKKEAILHFRKALDEAPHLADGYYNLGLALEREGDFDSALHVQEQALARCPESIQSWVGAARLLMKIADWGRVDALTSKIMDYSFSEADAPLLSSSLFLFQHLPMKEETLSGKHLEWGDLVEKRLAKHSSHSAPPKVRKSLSVSKLRVGYVSPDFRRHSVGWFFRHIIAHHDRDRFSIYCYATTPGKDDLTREIAGAASFFREVHTLNTFQFAELIQRDGIHVLVDLAGHTQGNRLDVFALRPAPIQVTFLGYPYGTGLRTMDYRITDRHSESPYSASLYRERLVFMSQGFLPMGPIEAADIPLERRSFGLPEDGPVCVSFNSAEKLRPEVLSLWDRLLSLSRDALLVISCPHVGRTDLRANILAHFSQENQKRVFFLGRAGSEELHRARYGLADIALDPFPYAGTTTSYEALSMGVPVVTLVGDRHAQRTTFSLLKAIGVEDTIARSEKEYLDIARGLLADPARLEDTKSRISFLIREKQRKHPRAYTKELEERFLSMWDRYFAGKAPRSMG